MKFPRSHLALIALLSFGLCSMVIAKFTSDPAVDRFTNEAVLNKLDNVELALHEPSDASPQTTAQPIAANANLTADEVIAASFPAAPQIAPVAPSWREIKTKVKPGDSLAAIFKRNGFNSKDVYLVSKSQPLGNRLRNIYPGHAITFKVDDNNELMGMAYSSGPLNKLEFTRRGDGFVGEQINIEPKRITAYKHGTIDHSLFVASQRAGLSDGLTMRLAQIFQWDVDFVLDIRPGDSFYVVYEELYLDGKFIGSGQILAAEFINQGDQYRAIRYADETGDGDYYAPNGESMRKAFLRAPVEFSRISSNFNLRRVHPLFKTVRPHRGIDYAAPSGTPILAAGDGRVVKSSRTKANGNYVVIQHGEQFVTKYLHLSKFGRGIRAGAKVDQGQTIGYVGATGWATAPHLHYEFLVNGVHKNPRTVSLPNAQPIATNEMSRFKLHTTEYSKLLDNYKSQISVAHAR